MFTSSSHSLIFLSSHPLIFTPLNILTSSQIHIFTSSHLLLLFTSSHLHILTSAHLHTSSLSLFLSFALSLSLSLLPSVTVSLLLFLFCLKAAGNADEARCFVGVSVAGVVGGAVTFCIDLYSMFFRDAFCVPSRFVCFWCWRQYGARAYATVDRCCCCCCCRCCCCCCCYCWDGNRLLSCWDGNANNYSTLRDGKWAQKSRNARKKKTEENWTAEQETGSETRQAKYNVIWFSNKTDLKNYYT